MMRRLNLEEYLLNLTFAGTRRRDCGRMTVAESIEELRISQNSSSNLLLL